MQHIIASIIYQLWQKDICFRQNNLTVKITFEELDIRSEMAIKISRNRHLFSSER